MYSKDKDTNMYDIMYTYSFFTKSKSLSNILKDKAKDYFSYVDKKIFKRISRMENKIKKEKPFIVVEGTDFSGKTTLANNLKSRLDFPVKRFPGSTDLGETLRPMLVGNTCSLELELLLQIAIFRSYIDTLDIDSNCIDNTLSLVPHGTIFDRYVLSTYTMEMIPILNYMTSLESKLDIVNIVTGIITDLCNLPQPDITIILMPSTSILYDRYVEKKDDIDIKDNLYRHYYNNYLQLLNNYDSTEGEPSSVNLDIAMCNLVEWLNPVIIKDDYILNNEERLTDYVINEIYKRV